MRRQRPQKQARADKGIPAIMQIGHNDTAIPFAADDRLCFLHTVYYIHLAYGRREIFTAMFQRNFFQRLGRRHIGNRISLALAQYIIGYGHQGIFLAKHAAVLTYRSEETTSE